MIVTFTSGSAPNQKIVELSNTPDPLPAHDFRIGTRTAIESAALVRAVNAKTFNRKNTVNQISFSVTRLHDSQEDADFFVLTHGRDVPKHGVLKIRTAGAALLSCTAGLESVDLTRQIGVTTIWRYNFISEGIS